MKKFSLIKSICVIAGLLTPAVALSAISCGSSGGDTPEAGGIIPIEDLLIEDKALLGLKPGVDVSMYDTLSVPNDVVEVSKSAFAKSGGSPLPESIKNIEFADGDQILYIAANAFSHCEYVENIKFSSRVAFVDERAFEYCKSLKTIDLTGFEDKLDKTSPFVEANVFQGCSQSGELILPDTINAIADAYDMLSGAGLGTDWFEFKPVIQDDIEGNAKYYVEPDGSKVLAGLLNYQSGPSEAKDTYTIPAEYTKIGPRALYSKFGDSYYGQIRKIVVEEGSQLKKICYGAFGCNKKITTIDLSNCKQLESIDVAAFQGFATSTLATVTLPNGEDSSLTNLGAYAFYGNGALTSADISNTKIARLGTGSFADCSKLSTLELPETAKWIGALIISGNKKIDSITIPKQVSYIGARAFKDCTAVSEINFDADAELKYIGQQAFYNCAAVQSIVIPDSVTYIGDGAFKIASLKAIGENDNPVYDVSPDYTLLMNSDDTELLTATSIANLATCFTNWTKLKKIHMFALENLQFNQETLNLGNTNLSYIGDYAFNNVKSSLEDGFEIVLPNPTTIKMEYVGSYAFANSDIKTINANNWGNAKLGSYLFNFCKKLTEIEIPTGIEEIPQYAFQYCDRITKITIPNTIQSIGRQAFYFCKNVSELHLESFTEVPNWTEKSAFSSFGSSIGNTINCYVDPSLANQWKELFEQKLSVDNIGQWNFIPYS